MRLNLDPSCPEARRLLGVHARAEVLMARGAEASHLARVLGEKRDKDLCEHLVGCSRCMEHARHCSSCGVDLSTRGHRFTCDQNDERWRGLVRGAEPPLRHLGKAALARPRPAPLPTAQAARPPPPPRASPPLPPPVRRRALPKRNAARQARESAWRVLGVEPGATSDEVKAAYRALAKQYHPDRVAGLAPDLRALAEARMREVNAAYAALE